jgi:predicted pyridoxine 5'-phosphate oxidase superfamily flavin-nucleotide-binding protein
MKKLPEEVQKAWDNMSGPAVFTTVDKDGKPNSIYVTCISRYDEGTLVVADNYFDKTKKNILSGSSGSLLFITGEKKSYQVKGPIAYITEGDIFEDMKKWNPKKHPGHAAAAIRAEEAYSGAKRLL